MEAKYLSPEDNFLVRCPTTVIHPYCMVELANLTWASLSVGFIRWSPLSRVSSTGPFVNLKVWILQPNSSLLEFSSRTCWPRYLFCDVLLDVMKWIISIEKCRQYEWLLSGDALTQSFRVFVLSRLWHHAYQCFRQCLFVWPPWPRFVGVPCVWAKQW